MVCAIEATPAEPDDDGRAAFGRLLESSLTELKERSQAPPTIAALETLQERYRGSSKRVVPTPTRIAKDLLRKPFRPIQPIVDVYNLWSARLGLSIGAFDIDRIQGSISLRITNGSERFRPLGANHSEKLVEPGGFAYVDDSGQVLCWLDVRQGESTKLTANTQKVIVIIEGVPPMTAEELFAAGKRVADSLVDTGAVSDPHVWIVQ
jgi:DNA/RNA-binding domain of Phe-tRNA-synthetase-like protein